MLVHAKNPRGVLYLHGYQIWGKETGYKPVDIPFKLYQACRDGLVDGTYREDYIKSKFGRPCPEVAFTYPELRYLPKKTIVKIADAIGLEFRRSWPRKRIIEVVKKAIRDVA